jgi:hypothetical protein
MRLHVTRNVSSTVLALDNAQPQYMERYDATCNITARLDLTSQSKVCDRDVTCCGPISASDPVGSLSGSGSASELAQSQ